MIALAVIGLVVSLIRCACSIVRGRLCPNAAGGGSRSRRTSRHSCLPRAFTVAAAHSRLACVPWRSYCLLDPRLAPATRCAVMTQLGTRPAWAWRSVVFFKDKARGSLGASSRARRSARGWSSRRSGWCSFVVLGFQKLRSGPNPNVFQKLLVSTSSCSCIPFWVMMAPPWRLCSASPYVGHPLPLLVVDLAGQNRLLVASAWPFVRSSGACSSFSKSSRSSPRTTARTCPSPRNTVFCRRPRIAHCARRNRYSEGAVRSMKRRLPLPARRLPVKRFAALTVPRHPRIIEAQAVRRTKAQVVRAIN